MIRLFGVSMAGSILLLLLSETVLITLCYVSSMYLEFGPDSDTYILYDGGWLQILLVVAVIQLGLYLNDLYEDFRPRRMMLLQQVCLIMGSAFILQAILGYGKSVLQVPKWTMVYGSGMVLVLIPIWRELFYRLTRNSVAAQKILFLGTSPVVREIIARLADRPELGMVAMGYLDSGTSLQEHEEIPSVPLLGSPEDVERVVQTRKPDRIVVGMSERRERLPVLQLLNLRFAGIAIEDAATTYEQVFSRVSTRDLRPSQLIFFAGFGPKPWSVTLQNIYSWIIALVAMMILLPIMLIVAVLVRVSSPGPVLFRQKRTGRQGVPFMVYKFRSMYQDAEARTGAVWATRDDPRITPVGRWLRKLRLDELPQLFNVLRGEMSIVGPRPERPEFVTVLAEKIPFFSQRHCIKPGITGWAQINHKYGDTVEDSVIKLEYDLYYIKNLMPAFDAYIIFHTIKVMLLSRGAQ
jgi:sugar transferase (PEP-CTERM system associated)